jgi:flagellar basal-body rod modification protein FlgD
MAAVQSTTAANTMGAKVDAGRTRLAENFEMFLTLLTTQLRNQDPLSPMDGNQFTQQLVQMTSVEQQLLSNDLLRQIAGKGDNAFTEALDLIGKGVTVESDKTTLSKDGAFWSYDLPYAAKSVKLEILDDKGTKVWEGPAAQLTKGRHQVEWDGKIAGKAAPPGVYTLKVTALDSQNTAMKTRTYTEGLVTGVEQKDGALQLSVGRTTVPMSAVQSVWLAIADQPAAPTTTQTTQTTQNQPATAV